MRHGHGTYRALNGDVYEGDWVDGKKTGKGVMKYVGGDVYEGDFVEGRRDGTGRYTFGGGDVYEGHWESDRKQGQGRMNFASGDVYDGEWWNDQVHGWGAFTWSDGTCYEGYFRNGSIEGDFCPNSDRDTRTGKVTAQMCDYFRGQCTRCGRFDRPCPVARTAPCQLRNGRCVRCGKTEKLLGTAQPDRYAFASTAGHSSQQRLRQYNEELEHRSVRRPRDDVAEPSPPAAAASPDPSSVELPPLHSHKMPAELPPAPMEAASDSPTPVSSRPMPFGSDGPDAVIAKAKELLENCRGGLGMAIADFPGRDGVVSVKVVTVKPGSPAWKAGLRRGDQLMSFTGREVVNKAGFLSVARDLRPGERRDVTINRGGDELTLTITGGATLLADDYQFLQRVVAGDVGASEFERVLTMRNQTGVVAW
eukprot:TRINITY_DN33289_c0_g1_i1.p1 TRINITY_DN33289_c0_g1~~TRINITY_DN33289_c0_g1_i1.p1  ORF type:complete len:421 (+),score=118.30 TRINITY_DN33289_c0_g1_i1:542-1804(+)